MLWYSPHTLTFRYSNKKATLCLEISYHTPTTLMLDIWVGFSNHFKPMLSFQKHTPSDIIHHQSRENHYPTYLQIFLNHFHIGHVIVRPWEVLLNQHKIFSFLAKSPSPVHLSTQCPSESPKNYGRDDKQKAC